jgi:hypothetical protein
MRWSRCRETAYARELRSLARTLNRHERCDSSTCPLHTLETVMARSLVVLALDPPEIIPWPTAKR